MSVELEPAELGFRRPFTREVSQELRLTNPHDAPVAFKVKTTAPRQYCVRPNSGTIEPKKNVSIQVLLQAMKEDPPLDARCRDKFLVQSAPITSSDGANVAAIWPEIEKNHKDTIKERKIRVTFLPAGGDLTPSQAPTAAAVNGTHTADESVTTYRSPSPTYGSPAHTSATPVKGEDNQQSTYDAAASTVASAAAATKETLQAQLAAAQAQIAKLKEQAEAQGLRQRKTEAVAQDSRERVTTGTTGQGVQAQPADGVSVQIVAALCLLSFLLAYFFF